MSRLIPRPGRTEGRWGLALLAAGLAVGFPIWVQRAADFAGYLRVGDVVLDGAHLYLDAPPGINTWPPFFSLLCVPLALLARASPYLARGVWLLLNAALLVVVLRLLARLVYGHAQAGGIGGVRVLVPLLLSARYVVGNFEHLQINVVLFALALGGLYLQATRRPGLGGLLVGLAAAIKIMPLAVVVYLGYRRRWRAAATAAMATAGFSLSPVLVFGWDRYRDYLGTWLGVVATGWGVGRMNQSVSAMWDRLLGHGLWPLATPGIEHLPDSGAPLPLAALFVSAGLVAAGALVAWRGRPRPDGWAALAEWSAVFLASAVFGPVAWKSYLIVTLLPNTLLFAVCLSPRMDTRTRAGAAVALAVAFVLGALPMPGLVGEALADRLEMSSAVTLAALVLLGGVLWLRVRLSDAPAPAVFGPACSTGSRVPGFSSSLGPDHASMVFHSGRRPKGRRPSNSRRLRGGASGGSRKTHPN
jgi:hypothetical protein